MAVNLGSPALLLLVRAWARWRQSAVPFSRAEITRCSDDDNSTVSAGLLSVWEDARVTRHREIAVRWRRCNTLHIV